MIKNGIKKFYLSLLLLFLWPLLTTCGPKDTPPPQIAIFPYPQTLSQAVLPLTGTKTAGTAVSVNGQAVTGYDDDSFFAVEIPLPVPGPNSFQVLAMNSSGIQSPAVAVTVTLNTTPPNPPVLTNSTLSSGTSPVLLTGTKDIGTDLLLNGKEIVGFNSSSSLNWTYTFSPTTAGNTTLQLASKNLLGVSSASVTYLLNYTGPLLSITPSTRPAPWPIAPLDGETFKHTSLSSTIQFSWTNTLSPTNRLQISSTPDFMAPIYDNPLVLSSSLSYTGSFATPGTYYWRVGAVDTANNVFYGQVRRFYYGKVTGDVNGDGYADILIGAQGSGGSPGQVFIYYGQPGNPKSTPDLILTGESPGDCFGEAIAVGDLNGDGYDDIIIGAYKNSAGGFQAGRVYIYFGRPVGVLSTPDMILTGLSAGEHFGVSLASGSDLNGDGYDDLLVGANLNSANGPYAGRAYLYYGGLKILNYPDRVFTGEAAGDHFGISVSMGGDINGDGFGDFLIGARGDGSASHAGQAYLYYGGFNQGVTPDMKFMSPSPNPFAGDGFGRMVKIIKDADGNGFADFLVGAPYHPDSTGTIPGVGEVYLYQGGPNLPSVQWKLSNPVNTSNAYFGFSAAALGDIAAKDGYADWVIGAWGGALSGLGVHSGWAAVYNGNPTLFTTTPPSTPAFKIYSGNSNNEGFGGALSSPGDFNGDGIPDLIAGAEYFGSGDGAAYFYNGHFNPKPSPDYAILGPPKAISGFGFDVH